MLLPNIDFTHASVKKMRGREKERSGNVTLHYGKTTAEKQYLNGGKEIKNDKQGDKR